MTLQLDINATRLHRYQVYNHLAKLKVIKMKNISKNYRGIRHHFHINEAKIFFSKKFK